MSKNIKAFIDTTYLKIWEQIRNNKISDWGERLNPIYSIPLEYLEIYSLTNDDLLEQSDSFDTKIKIIFAFYHSKINDSLKFLNYCSHKPNRHFNASSSRELLETIEFINDLTNDFKDIKFNNKYQNYFEYILKNNIATVNYGVDLPQNFIAANIIRYEPIFEYSINNNIKLEDESIKTIETISTNSAPWQNKSQDQKLLDLCNIFEYLLRSPNNKYNSINDEEAFSGLINDSLIKKYKDILQIFRHNKQSDIDQRKNMSKKRKDFLIDFGKIILNVISKYKNKQ